MKKPLSILVLMLVSFSTFAENRVRFDGRSSFTELPSGQIEVAITGLSAQALFEHMTESEEVTITSDDGTGAVSLQRVGRNVTCAKDIKNSRTSYSCSFSDVKKDGRSVGAAG